MKALVQVRGEVNMEQGVRDTLEMLNIHAVNHCTFVPETDTYEGMIYKVNDYVAYGEPSADVVATLLRRRGSPAEGDADVDDEWVASHTEYGDVDELAQALVDEETTLKEAGLDRALCLHPPRGGHDGIKGPTTEGGQLGQHSTEQIDELLVAMR
jgi:large subunit ribosomal protein L30